jgi:hypothetical protein
MTGIPPPLFESSWLTDGEVKQFSWRVWLHVEYLVITDRTVLPR